MSSADLVRSRFGWLLPIGAAILLALLGRPAAAGAAVSCGDRIDHDVVLERDLLGCPDNGLIVEADGVTVDLNGHRITGDGDIVQDCQADFCDVGIGADRHDGVVVKHGSITDFGLGVFIGGGENVAVRGLKMNDNAFLGIVYAGITRGEIARSAAKRNGIGQDLSDLGLFESSHLAVRGNSIADPGDIGIYTEQIKRSSFTGNRFTGCSEAAVLLTGSTRDKIARNHAHDNGDGLILDGDRNRVVNNSVRDTLGGPEAGGFGISVAAGHGNRIVGNRVTRSDGAGIQVGYHAARTKHAVVRGNHVSRSRKAGIVNTRHTTHSRYLGNVVTKNGGDGIDVRGRWATIGDSVARRNGDLGIRAPGRVHDAGGNRAAHNGDRRQCTHVRC